MFYIHIAHTQHIFYLSFLIVHPSFIHQYIRVDVLMLLRIVFHFFHSCLSAGRLTGLYACSID